MSTTVRVSAPAIQPRCRFVASIFVAAAACAGEQQSPSRETTDGGTATVDGVELVGTSEAIAHIADIAEADDGTLWILNDAEPWFIAMSPDGGIVRSWGRTGGGPNEFRNPTTLLRDAASGHVFVIRLRATATPPPSSCRTRCSRAAPMDPWPSTTRWTTRSFAWPWATW